MKLLEWFVVRGDHVIRIVVWPKQMTKRNQSLALVLFCICGCTAESDSTSSLEILDYGSASESGELETTEFNDIASKIRPGVYGVGLGYDRVSQILATADAKIRLDYHSGIKWYDRVSQKWTTLDDIDEVEALLASTQEKHLVTVSTGKADWDKCDEYVAKIRTFADGLGFDATVVTTDYAQGLFVSSVTLHQK